MEKISMCPRINIDDSLLSQEEFFSLFEAVGNRDKALGMLVRLLKLAQERYVANEVIQKDEIERCKLTEMIGAGWLVETAGGYMVRDPEKHFGWLRQKIVAGKKRAAGQRDSLGQFTSGPGGINQLEQTGSQPLAPAPSLSPAPVEYIAGSTPLSPTFLAHQWNELCGHISLVRTPESLNSKRHRMAIARIRETPDAGTWKEAMGKVAKSAKCQGKENPADGPYSAWKATFDWLLAAGRIDEVLEGKWDGRQTAKPSLSFAARMEQEER